MVAIFSYQFACVYGISCNCIGLNKIIYWKSREPSSFFVQNDVKVKSDLKFLMSFI